MWLASGTDSTGTNSSEKIGVSLCRIHPILDTQTRNPDQIGIGRNDRCLTKSGRDGRKLNINDLDDLTASDQIGMDLGKLQSGGAVIGPTGKLSQNPHQSGNVGDFARTKFQPGQQFPNYRFARTQSIPSPQGSHDAEVQRLPVIREGIDGVGVE